jgi:outer membrane immunogenic protein
MAMKKLMVVAFVATLLTPGVCSAADWVGLYFGVNAGYGWAQGSSTVGFTGPGGSGTTTPTGLGATELSGTGLIGSGNLNGGVAGGQIGSNWQAGSVVFGIEIDAQAGQKGTFSVVCTTGCTATEAVNIILATGRARIGWAFDWILPYVTAGGAIVNARDNLTVTVGGLTANFPSLSNNTLGWTAGAGFEVALSSHWSAKFEYLYIRANNLTASATIPGTLGTGTASETAGYRDNIVRVGLNYRFGPSPRGPDRRDNL